MPVLNSIAAFADDMTAWRRHIHAHPELALDCHKTAAFVVDRLREMGITDIHTGIATSGVVAVIEGQGDGPTTALRADMDALPIMEDTGASYASTVPGKMHACGHDGHTAMLLGAARYLQETRKFRGRVVLLFQPAEETIGGGRIMVEEGVMNRFGVDEVYAIHTDPYSEAGHFSTAPGPLMAAVDDFTIRITGQGGHAAYPQLCIDPIPAALAIGQALQSIPARNAGGNDKLVVSLTAINAGTAYNVIPETAELKGTVRSFDADLQDHVEARMTAICEGQSAAFGVEVELDYQRDYPATINHATQAAFGADTAAEVSGEAHVVRDQAPEMGAEDFSFMLQARPGAFFFLGQGLGPSVHHPKFDFNDSVATIGASFLARLVERRAPLKETA